MTKLMPDGKAITRKIKMEKRVETLQEKTQKFLDGPFKKVAIEENSEMNYRLLGRLQADCEYFINTAPKHGPNEKVLHQGNVKDQIKKMKSLLKTVGGSTEWISIKDITRYEKQMTALLKK
jgi:hypothetical protein